MYLYHMESGNERKKATIYPKNKFWGKEDEEGKTWERVEESEREPVYILTNLKEVEIDGKKRRETQAQK